MGTQLHPPKMGHSLPELFDPCLYCGETAGWIKMSLGTAVGLGPCRIVLDRYAAPAQKGHSPKFSAHVYCGQTVAHLIYC